MRNLLTLTRREVGQLLVMPSLYVVMALVTALYSFVFYSSIIGTGDAFIEPIAMIVGAMSIFLVPVITMRSFAGETSSGTIEMLLTSPVKPFEVVLSKFLGCYFFYAVTLLPCLGYVGLLAWCGDIDNGVVISAMLGLLLSGATMVSVGVFASCLSGNLIVAAAAACAGISTLFYLSYPIEQAQSVYSFPAYLSFWAHFKDVLLKGMIDSRSICQLLTVPAFFVFLTWLVVSSRGMLSRAKSVVRRRWQLASAVLAIAGLNCALFAGYMPLDVEYGGQVGQVMTVLSVKGFGAFLAETYSFVVAVMLMAASLYCLRVSKREKAVESGKLPAIVRDRWLSRSWPTLLSAFSVLVIVININFLATLFWWGSDVTENGINTLSPETRQTLDQLDETLEITVFYSESENYRDVPLLNNTRDLLREFGRYCTNVKLTYADAINDEARADKLAKKMKIDTTYLSGLAVVAYKGRTLYVPAPMLLKEPDWKEKASGIDRPIFRGELTFTTALKRILDPRMLKVYFTIGHGEMDIAEKKATKYAAGRFAHALEMNSFEVESLMFGDGKTIPADCDALIIACPRLPFGEKAIKTINDYANSGGSVAILMPSVEDVRRRDEGLRGLIRTWGGTVRDDWVFDQQNSHNKVPTTIFAVRKSDVGPKTADGRDIYCIVPKARSIRIDRERALKSGWYSPTPWLLSMPTASRQWKSPTDGKFKVKKGQVVLSFASVRPGSEEHGESRVMVVGNSEFASNSYLDMKYHNKAFLVSSVKWLSGRDYSTEVKDRLYVDRSFRLSTGERTVVWWVSQIAFPQLWALMGLLVWWLRRQ